MKKSFSTLIARTQNNQLKRNRIKLSVYVWDRTMRTIQTIWSRFGPPSDGELLTCLMMMTKSLMFLMTKNISNMMV